MSQDISPEGFYGWMFERLPHAPLMLQVDRRKVEANCDKFAMLHGSRRNHAGHTHDFLRTRCAQLACQQNQLIAESEAECGLLTNFAICQ
jgi:hypothetical protein